MAFETVYLLTGSADKRRAAQAVFDEYDIPLESFNPKQPEIQASTSLVVAQYAVAAAFEELQKPVLREDHSFYIRDLGIPGPYMSYMDKTVSAEQLVRIVDTLPSRDAYFEVAAAYKDAGRTYEAAFQVPVVIATAPQGNPELNWERVMMLPGEAHTFAEVPSSEREHLWQQNYRTIAEQLVRSAVDQPA